MKILVVDKTTEAQTFLSKKIDSLESVDQELLNLSVKLSDPESYLSRLPDTHVLLLGAELGDEASSLAHAARIQFPDLEILMFVSPHAYSRGVFRSAHTARVRKVLPSTASEMDLLQELVSIHEELRQNGRVRKGQLITVLHAKGGVGATSICAALGEVSANFLRSTLLWDLDIETSDLTRSLGAVGPESRVLSSLIDGSRAVTRESFNDAMVSLNKYVSVLPTPHVLPAAIDLVGHPDSVGLVRRFTALARVNFDTIIVDTGGRIGPAAGTLTCDADIVLVVIDDSLLGLNGARALIERLLPIIKNHGCVRFLCSGISLKKAEVAAHIGECFEFLPEAWSLPVIPCDPSAAHWAGKGKTLYSAGSKATRKALEEVARALDLPVMKGTNVTSLPLLRSVREETTAVSEDPETVAQVSNC
jgi:MinD-like ATPase involved in chromosome partitioning or flagellar assembly